MAESIIQKAGGGAASDECTAAKAQVLAGYTAVTKDSGDEPAAGTMADRGAVSQALNCGGSYTIPAGYHNGSGKVTANSLASQTGGATAEDKYVLNGKTYWKDGVKRTGGMTVASVASFSVAAYSTSQVLATWKNPSRGPYSGVAICAKTGGYPANINDGRVYTGVGSNSAVNGTSSQIIGGLAAGTTYYFRIWVYCTCSAGDQYSGYLQATCAPTAHGRAAFTSSGAWTVPANVRSINIHCTGGGGGGSCFYNTNSENVYNGGDGGGGGYTSYRNGISVSPGQTVTCTIGAGGVGGINNTYSSRPTIYVNPADTAGGTSLAVVNGITITAYGGNRNPDGAWKNQSPPNGGSGGGQNAQAAYGRTYAATVGASDGQNSNTSRSSNSGVYAKGQGSNTREFGTGVLYSGGGGGGGAAIYHSGSESNIQLSGVAGGAGGGGKGGGVDEGYTGKYQHYSATGGAAGSFGSGGGGGGGSQDINAAIYGKGGNGGSGNVIITW